MRKIIEEQESKRTFFFKFPRTVFVRECNERITDASSRVLVFSVNENIVLARTGHTRTRGLLVMRTFAGYRTRAAGVAWYG